MGLAEREPRAGSLRCPSRPVPPTACGRRRCGAPTAGLSHCCRVPQPAPPQSLPAGRLQSQLLQLAPPSSLAAVLRWGMDARFKTGKRPCACWSVLAAHQHKHRYCTSPQPDPHEPPEPYSRPTALGCGRHHPLPTHPAPYPAHLRLKCLVHAPRFRECRGRLCPLRLLGCGRCPQLQLPAGQPVGSCSRGFRHKRQTNIRRQRVVAEEVSDALIQCKGNQYQDHERQGSSSNAKSATAAKLQPPFGTLPMPPTCNHTRQVRRYLEECWAVMQNATALLAKPKSKVNATAVSSRHLAPYLAECWARSSISRAPYSACSSDSRAAAWER